MIDEDLDFKPDELIKSAELGKKRKFKGFPKPALTLWTIGGLNLTQTIVQGLQSFKDAGKKRVSQTFWPNLRLTWSDIRNTDAWRHAHPEEAAQRDEQQANPFLNPSFIFIPQPSCA